MNVRNVARGLYATFGLGYLIAGIGILAYRTGLLPPMAIEFVYGNSDNNSNTLHIMQEFGTHLVAAGIRNGLRSPRHHCTTNTARIV